MSSEITGTTGASAGLGDDFGRAWVTLIHETLTGAADALGDLDRRAGDGDFGTNIRTAMQLLSQHVEEGRPSDYAGWVTALYRAWLGVGGTSGPLLGMFFRDLAKAADGTSASGGGSTTGASAADGSEPTLAGFADALAAGQATVQRYGEAKVGDKTMVDAVDPAVTALKDAAEAGADPPAALGTAATAAINGAKDTADVIARRGRASYVGEAARGVIDPGAAAIALVIDAARAAAAGESGVDTDWVR